MSHVTLEKNINYHMKTYKTFLFVLFIIVLTFGNTTKGYSQSVQEPFVIMIDPGHGGKDSGTRGTRRYKTYEKDIALDVSLALGKQLEKKIPNIKVVYTRKKDVFPTLISRPQLANKKEADLFISIHCNAQPGTKGTAYGSETFVLGLHKEAMNLEVVKRENSVIKYEDNHEEVYKEFNVNSQAFLMGLKLAQEEYLDHSIRLATYIEDEFEVTAKRRSRGVKQAGFYVLAYTYMPSVLVELGFLTHKREEDFLNSKKGKALMTKSLFTAVKKYLDYLDVSSNKSNDLIAINDKLPSDTDLRNNIQFKVQIATGSNALETKPYNFKGLQEITRIKDGSVYKYYYGATTNYNKINELKKEAVNKGYTSSYIVAFKDGKKIPLSDAIKSTAN